MKVKGSMMMFVVKGIRDFDSSWEPIYHLIAGWLERTVELAGGRDPRVEITARSWKGEPSTIFRIAWS